MDLMNAVTAPNTPDRKRATRRTALWLACLAVAFYVGFIVLSILRGS
jgi:hypothetical protein